MMMKRLWILAVVLLAGLGAVAAQDGPPLDATYTTDDGQISFRYPSAWAVDAQMVPAPQGRTLLVAFLASNAQAAGKMQSGETFVPEDAIVGLSVGELWVAYGLSPEASAVDVLNAAITRTGQTYSTPVTGTLAGRPAAQAVREVPGVTEVDTVVAYGNGVFAFTALFAAPAAVETWLGTALAVAETLQVGGTPPPGTTATPAPTLNAATISLSERFVSDDGRLRFAYPPGWTANASPLPSDGGPVLTVGYMVSAPSVVQKIAQGAQAQLAPNEVGLSFLTGELTTAYDLPRDAAAAEIAQAVAQRSGYQDYQIFATLIAGRPAARTPHSAPGHDAVDLIVEHSNDTFTLITLFAPRGSLADWVPVGLAFASLIVYDAPPPPTPVPFAATATSASGRLEVGVPAGWVSRLQGNSTIYLGTSEDVLSLRFGNPVAAGKAQMLVNVTERAVLLDRLGLNATADPVAILTAIMEQSAGQSAAVYGSPRVLSVNRQDAARGPLRGDGFEGFAMIIDVGETIVALQLISARGEIATWLDTLDRVADSVRYLPQE